MKVILTYSHLGKSKKRRKIAYFQESDEKIDRKFMKRSTGDVVKLTMSIYVAV